MVTCIVSRASHYHLNHWSDLTKPVITISTRVSYWYLLPHLKLFLSHTLQCKQGGLIDDPLEYSGGDDDRRKVCRGLWGIGSVGPKWLVNGRIVTGLRLVDHSTELMLQASAQFLHNYVCRYLCIIVLCVTVNVTLMCLENLSGHWSRETELLFFCV